MMRVISLAAAALFVLAGCTVPAEDIEFTHVHGAAFVPLDATLYLGTHYGVVQGEQDGESWTWSYVGDERYDYMGFAQDGNKTGVFYSSGHPNVPQDYGGVHLGLRRSVDGATTWEQRSLKGETDFHAMTGVPGQGGLVVGAWEGRIMVSPDAGASWIDRAGPPDVMALAATTGALFAATPNGLYVSQSTDGLAPWNRLAGDGEPGSLSSLATSVDGALLLASSGDYRTGTAVRSLDEGASWEPLSEPVLRDHTRPVIFAVDPENVRHAFASTSDGAVFESLDAGETWRSIRTI